MNSFLWGFILWAKKLPADEVDVCIKGNRVTVHLYQWLDGKVVKHLSHEFSVKDVQQSEVEIEPLLLEKLKEKWAKP